ncbi:MAG: electron transfer flavoprotein subunit alpha/FixB family protein [Phycisphaerales bacterium]
MAGVILIYVQQRSGRSHPASLQLFTLARQLADQDDSEIHAVVVGHDVAAVAEAVTSLGATQVHVADDPELRMYRVMPYTRALCGAIEQARATVVLLATTSMSRDLAPRVAARLGAALATDCIDVTRHDGVLRVKRPMYCAKCIGEVKLAADRAQVITVRPNSYAAPAAPNRDVSSTSTPFTVALTEDDTRVTAIDLVPTSGATKDVAEADIIVSGGRSLKSEENFKILYELAEVLDAAVGASRAAVDAGYQPQARQVGLTGKVVNPRLYVACGIDGAIQHLAGMRGSKVIVAINTKAEAPIFSVATYGCVVDLFTLVPLLSEEFRKLNGDG